MISTDPEKYVKKGNAPLGLKYTHAYTNQLSKLKNQEKLL